MTILTVAPAVRTGVGLELTGVAASAGGDSYPNTGQELFMVYNAEAAPKTVTVAIPAKVDGDLGVTSKSFVLPASKNSAIGPFPPGTYNDANGLVQLTYSGVTTMTVQVVKVTPAS